MSSSKLEVQLATQKDRLVQSLFANFRKQVDPKLEDEKLLQLVHVDGAAALKALSVASWNTAAPCRIRHLKATSKLYQPHRVVGTITELRDGVVVRVPGADGEFIKVETACIRITDPDGDSLWSTELIEPDIQPVLDLRRQAATIEFLCVPVDVPLKPDAKLSAQALASGPRGFLLHVLDVRESTSMLDLLGASAAERQNSEALLAKLKSEGVSPHSYLFEQVVKRLKIAGLEDFTELRELIHFAVLQSLSGGQVDHAPGRLHGLVVGPPGQGKKLVSLAAKALNVACVQLSATKYSVAGLVGASRRTDAGWVSQPGLLPQAAHGVAILQDGHGWEGSRLRAIAPMLQEVMEDGFAGDSVAGGQRRATPTSLLIDLNKRAHVTSTLVGGGPEAGLLGIRPFVSRLDFIGDIPEDAHRSWLVSRNIYKSLGSGVATLDCQPWVRELRLLVATLRDRNPDVTLEGVRDLMAAVHDDVYSANAADFASMPEASDIPARLAITFARLVGAAARGRDADEAEPCDIDVATTFINRKLQYLKVRGTSYPSSATGTSSPQQRAAWFTGLAGREVRTADVVNAYKAQTGEVICERTARRHIQRTGGERTGKGQYLIPTTVVQQSEGGE